MTKQKVMRVGAMGLIALVTIMVVVGFVYVLQSKAVEVEPAEVQAGASWPMLLNSSAITENTTFSARQWNWSGQTATIAEVWYSIDQGTTNTMTLYLDASPDDAIWKTGEKTVVSANAADATGYVTATIVGRYFRVRATVTNANAVTPTVKAILK